MDGRHEISVNNTVLSSTQKHTPSIVNSIATSHHSDQIFDSNMPSIPNENNPCSPPLKQSSSSPSYSNSSLSSITEAALLRKSSPILIGTSGLERKLKSPEVKMIFR